MEKLKEAYEAINPNATIEVQMSDSTSGMTGAMEGTYDIGMASRELKDSEKEALTPHENRNGRYRRDCKPQQSVGG